MTEENTNDSYQLGRPLAVENDMMAQSLDQFSIQTGMPIRTENRQRRYGPPLDFVGVPPSRGSEVFIGGLPRDCFEPELVPILENVGRLFELRLMVNYNGNTRGFAFAQYFNPTDAEKAVNELNNFEIRRGRRITVLKSINKCTLHLKNLPKNKDEYEIRRELDRIADGIVMVTAPKNATAGGIYKNRGFAFVEFESHRSATDFLSSRLEERLVLWERDIIIDWAQPLPEREAINIFNVSSRTSVEYLTEVFNNVSRNGVVRVNKIVNSATIYFQTQSQAEMAKSAMDGKFIDGFRIQIKMNSLNWMNDRGETDETDPSPQTERTPLLSHSTEDLIENNEQQNNVSYNSHHDGDIEESDIINNVVGMPECDPPEIPTENSLCWSNCPGTFVNSEEERHNTNDNIHHENQNEDLDTLNNITSLPDWNPPELSDDIPLTTSTNNSHDLSEEKRSNVMDDNQLQSQIEDTITRSNVSSTSPLSLPAFTTSMNQFVHNSGNITDQVHDQPICECQHCHNGDQIVDTGVNIQANPISNYPWNGFPQNQNNPVSTFPPQGLMMYIPPVMYYNHSNNTSINYVPLPIVLYPVPVINQTQPSNF